MKATEILSQEHRVIEMVLNCLEKMVEKAGETQRIDEQAARDAIDFFRHYADGCHHAKEENHLFPAMEAKGFDRDAGPLSVMLYEHNVGRDAVRGMEQAIDEYVGGTRESAGQFVSHAIRFMSMLRQHIEKEDHCLFTMADQAFSGEEQAQLLDRFAEAERDMVGELKKNRYLELAERLASRYQVDSTSVQRSASGSHACGSTSCKTDGNGNDQVTASS